MKRVVVFCFYLLAASPLVYWPWSMVPFVLPKMAFFYAVCAVLFCAYAVLAFREPRFRPRLTIVTGAFLLFIAVLFITLFTGVDVRQSLWSIPERGIGAIAWLMACTLVFIASGMGEVVSWRRVFIVSVVVSAVIAASAIIMGGGRPGGLLGSPNFLAAYLTLQGFVSLVLAHEAYKTYRTYRSYSFALIAVLDFLVVFITQTRASLIALGAAVFVALLIFGINDGKKWPLALAAALVFMSALFVMTRTVPMWQSVPRLERFTGTAVELSAGRVIAWQSALAGIKERPLTGWGFENFDSVFNAHYEPRYARLSAEEGFFSKPHNLFLEYALAGGIPLLIVFTLCMTALAYIVGPLWAGFFIAYAVQSFFLFDSYGTFISFALVAGYAAGTAPRGKPLAYGAWLFIPLCAFAVYGAVGIVRDDVYAYQGFSRARAGDLPAAFTAWDTALHGVGPYADVNQKLHLSLMADLARFPSLREAIRPRIASAFAGVEKGIKRRPRAYLFRAAYADAAASLASIDPVHLARAEEHVLEMARLSPRRQQTHYIRAKLALARGDRASALNYMKEAVAFDPAAAGPHFMTGMIAFAADDLAYGIREIERARELGRDARDAHEARTIADAYGDLGRYDEALRYYDAALVFNPQDTVAAEHKALVEKYRARGL